MYIAWVKDPTASLWVAWIEDPAETASARAKGPQLLPSTKNINGTGMLAGQIN
jgi:hypothetical protein